MVVEENIDERLVKHYSDKGLMIKKDGTNEVYEEAVDLISKGYTYSETDYKIDEPDQMEEDMLVEEILNLIKK